MSTVEPLACAGATSRTQTREFLATMHAHFDRQLRRFFARQGARLDEIEDLTQEVYLRLARQPRHRSIHNLRAFVFTTATNLLRDRVRWRLVRGCELSVESDSLVLEDAHSDPEYRVGVSLELQAALSILNALKPSTRRAFVSHRLLGRSHSQIARELGVSISMVEKHMTCAAAALRPLQLRA